MARGPGVFYAGETVVWVADLTENDGRVQLTQPENGVTIQVKNEAETTVLLAETPMALVVIETANATGASALQLDDTTKAWDEDEWADAVVMIASGTGSGQARRIKRNTATELVLEDAWGTIPDATSVYKIHRGRYEYAWASSSTPQTVVGIVRAKASSYTSAEKVEIELEGAAI